MQVATAVQPHVTVTGRHLAITAAINDYAEKKIEGLHLNYPKIIEAHVILEVDKYRHRAEVVLVCCNHITIEASEESNDLYHSMDQVTDKIARQMRKYKTRLLRQQRPHRNPSVRYLDEQVFGSNAFENLAELAANGYHDDVAAMKAAASLRGTPAPAAATSAANAAAAPLPAAEIEREIIKTEKYAVKPMYVDDAVLQMQMSEEQQFVVFTNAKTEEVNVLYRRKEGDFGLIQPVFN